jgi:hypothetical protein
MFGSACAGTSGGRAAAQWVHFESGVGGDAFDLRRTSTQLTLYNTDDRILVSVHERGDRWEIENSEGDVVALISRVELSTSPRFLLSGRPDREDIELKVELDGDLKIKQASGVPLFKLKKREYGFKIVDPQDQTIGRVRQSEAGKISVRDENNLTYLSTRDSMPIEAATILMVPGLDLASATGFAAVLWRWQEDAA